MPSHQTELDLPRSDDIKIGDVAPVVRASGDKVEVFPAKFGFPPPPRRKGGTVFNFVSENRSFSESKRCLIPASAFFDTGTKYPKAKHRFTLNGAPMFAIAGLWRDELSKFWAGV